MDDSLFSNEPAPDDSHLFSEEPAPPVQGGIESAARGALRNVPFAQQAAAAIAPINPLSEKANYSDELAHLTEAAEQGKAQNPKSYYTGAAAGTLAPLLIPGAGEVATAARGAGRVGGALNAGAQSLSDVNLTKPTGRDVANTAIAAGLGGVLGKMFGPKAAPAAEAATSEPEKIVSAGYRAGEKLFDTGKTHQPTAELKDFFNGDLETPVRNGTLEDGFLTNTGRFVDREEAQKMTGAATSKQIFSPETPVESAVPGAVKSVATSAVPTPQLGGISHKPVAPDFVNPPERVSASLIAQGLGGTPRQQLKLYIGKDPVEAANEIGTWMKTADSGKSIAGIMDRPGELLRKIETIHDTAGKTIGDVIEKVAPGANVDGGALAFHLDKLLDETYDANAEHAILKLQGQIQKAEEAGRLDFQALQKIKGSFGRQAKAAGHDMAGSSVKQAYGILSQYMNDAVDQFGSHVKDPELLGKYNKAKVDYKNASNLLPLLRYQEVKEMIGGPSGHTTLLGLLGKIAHQGSMAVGVPPPEQLVKNAMLKAGTAMSPAAAPVAAPAARGVVQASAPSGLNRAAQLELSNALESRFKVKK